MKVFTFITSCFLLIICMLTGAVSSAVAQRTFATSQQTGAAGVLCLNCTVNNSASAADGNLQTYSTINVAVGIAAQTYQEAIFPNTATTKVPANTPVSVKLGSADNLLSLQALGAITLQAYNGGTAIGTPLAASSLISLLDNNNQVEVSLTPTQAYDRVRVTLNGGLVGALNAIYFYEAFYNAPGAAVACNTAFDELHGISSGLLNLGLSVGGVVNPQQAIDGNINTASTLNAGLGLVGAYAQQTALLSSPSVLGDSVRLVLSLPQALLDAGVLSNISVSTYNGNTSNNDSQSLNSSLLNVRLLELNGANRKVTVTYAPASIFDRVQLRLGGGIANVLSTLNLYEVQRVIPRPIVKVNNAVVSNVQVCTGSTATLVATAVANTTFNWYTAATGGSPIASGASFTTPALTATTTYYAEAVRTGCTDASDRTPVTVTVNAIPVAPVVVNSALTVCPGQTVTFAANPIAGVTINWYTAATGGTLVATGNNFTTPALTVNTTYYAEAVSGGTCVSPTRTAVTATISTLPATPALTAAGATICDGNVAVLSVSNPLADVTYNWYSAATGGTILYTGTNFTTPALHANTNYYIEAVNATGCNSAQRAQATVTVQPLPADPILSASSNTVIAGQPTTLSVTNAQTGITYNWYTSATAATPVFTGTPFTTPALYATTTYYISGVNSTGCASANKTAITVNVTVNNNTPCSYANNQTNTVNGICIGCSISTPALAADADTTTASTLHVVAGLVGGYSEQQLTFQQPGFAGDTIKLGLQSPVNLADAAIGGSVQVLLYNGATLVNQYGLDNSLVKVSLLGGGNGKYVVYIPAGGNYDRVTVRLNSGVAGLVSALQIYYAQQQFPKPIFSPLSPEICKGGTATLNITSPTNGTLTWYDAPVGGNIVHTGASFTTPALNGNTTYYIEYARNGCGSPVRTPVAILVDDTPAAPAVTANNVTVNSGQTATLVATPPANATINWYTAATGGTPVATGNTFTTAALTANTVYYAESASGSCTSPTRTAVTVNVNPVVIPDIAVTPPTQTIPVGQSTTFTASSTTAGAVFKWYTSPTGGTSIFTGATLVTPAQFANNTYYAEASIPATGAVSAVRAIANVVVTQDGVSPVACDAAISQTVDVNGLLCVGCAVNNAAGSVDNDRNTFSQLSITAGLVGGTVSQTLRFANTGHAADSVVVELGIPGSLADVSALSGISLATYNGATYNNDRFNVNGALLNVTLLNGTTRFRVAFPATADFDRVEIRANSGVAGVLTAVNIYDATQEVAAPVIAVAGTSVCAGAQATLTATATSDATVKWYTAATGGTPVFTGLVFTTPVLNTTTTYYAEASRTADNCVQLVRTPTTVTVNPVPAAPVVAQNNTTICAGSTATFAAQPVTGVTVNWYDAPTGGNIVATGNSFTTPALTATTSYYAEAVGAGSCGSSTRTVVTVTVNNSVTNPVIAQTPVQICAGSSALLSATSPQAGVTFNWYTAATGGTPVFTGAQFTTPALTANTSYYVEAAAGNCVSPDRIRADVIVNPVPDAPTVAINPASGQISSGQTATLTASSTTAGATFNWYTMATGGTPVATGAVFTTPTLTSTTTYYAESANATGCVSASRTAVTITVIPTFSTNCDFASSQLTDVNAGVLCVGCGIDDPNFSVDVDTTNFSHLHITAGVAGSYVAQSLIFNEPGVVGDSVSVMVRFPGNVATVGLLDRIRIGSYNGATYNNDGVFLNNNLVHVQVLAGGQSALIKFAPQAVYDRVEVRLNSSLAGLFNSLDVFFASKQVESPLLAAASTNICSGSSATFTVSNARAGVTYQWYSAATGGTLLATGTTFTANNVLATTTYYVQSSRIANSCPNPNRVSATVNVTQTPVNPTVTVTNAQPCAGDQVTLAVTNAGTATVNWYDAATGGNLLFTGANYIVSPNVTTTYYAELANGVCTSPARTATTITVSPRPAAPGVQSANVTVCTGSTATLQVVSPEAGVTYSWYTTATGGTAVGTGATFTTPAINQATTFYVEAASATGCINNGGRTAVNVTTNGQIAAPVLSATNTNVCAGGSASISVVNPVSGISYNFYTIATGGVPVFTGVTLTINNATANATYYVEASNGSGCTSATRTQTAITVTPVPNAPQVQAGAGGLSVCSGGSAILNILNPQAGVVYRWFDAAANGTLLFTGTEFHTPALTANTTYYVEAAQDGNCNPSARTAANVTVNALPQDVVLAAANVNICAGGNATLSVNSPQAGIIYQWFDSPALTNKLFEGATFNTPALSTNTNYYVVAVNAGGCSSANAATAQVTVKPAPAAPIVANGTTVQSCAGAQVALTIANPQNGFTYNWYADATGGTPLSTGASFTTAALTNNATYYAEAANETGCASASRTAVSINVNSLPVAPVVTAQGGSATPSVCAGSSATLVASSSTANISFNWYIAATGGTPIFTGATYTTPALSANTTYYVEAVSNNGGCISTTRTAIQVIINNTTAAQPTVNTGDLSICANSAANIHIANPDANTTYNWYAGSTDATPIFTGTVYTTPVLAANTTYYVEAASAQSCNPSTRTVVAVTVVNRPDTPVPAAASVNACAGSNVTLSIASPQAGLVYNWYDSPSKTNLLFTGASFTTPVINANTTYYVDATNGACTSASVASVQVTVSPAPAAPILINSSVNTCAATQATFAIASPQSGFTYNWYTTATGGSAVYTGTSFTTPVINANTTFYAEAVNATGCNSSSRAAATVTVLPAPAAPVVSSANTIVCPNSSATISASSTDANSVITWYDAAVGGNLLYTGATFTTPVLSATTIFYAQSANAGGCSNATRAAATVQVSAAPTAPVVSVASVTSSTITFTWNAANGAVAYLVSLDKGLTFITPSSGATGLTETITGLQPNQSVSIVVKAIGTTTCQLSSLSNALTATTANPAGNTIFVPNAFTPNGDGKNDQLQVYGSTIQKLDFWVYDQWGEMQYHSNTQAGGWDGTYKGKPQPVGVYVYYLEATMADGQIMKKKGTINLIR